MSDAPFSPDLPAADRPVRVSVELISSADVARLEARDEAVRQEVEQLRKEMEGLRRSFYELLEVFATVKRSRPSQK